MNSTPNLSGPLATKQSCQATRRKRRISEIERLVRFLVDMMLGLISAFFAIVGAAFVDGNVNWPDMICAGVLAFLIAMWLANFVFPNAVRWCLTSESSEFHREIF